MQLRGLFLLGGHLGQARVPRQRGVDEVGQGLHGAVQHEQRAGGRHAVAGLERARKGGAGQLGVIARLAGVAAGFFQRRAGLQPLHAGDHAGIQHPLRGGVMLLDGGQRCFAQHGGPFGQLSAEVALHQQGGHLVAGLAGIGFGLLRLGLQQAACGVAGAPHVEGPDGRDRRRGVALAAVERVAGGQVRQLRQWAGQRRGQVRQDAGQHAVERVQVHVQVGVVGVGRAAQVHHRAAQALHGVAAQLCAFNGVARGGELVGALAQLLQRRVERHGLGLGRQGAQDQGAGSGKAQQSRTCPALAPVCGMEIHDGFVGVVSPARRAAG